MKKLMKLIMAIMMSVSLVSAMIITSEAVTVTKVSAAAKYANGKQYVVLTGKTSANKKVWTFKGTKTMTAQSTPFSYKVYGKYVYVLDQKKFFKLNKNTGKLVGKKKTIAATGSYVTVNSKGSTNFYVDGSGFVFAGYFDTYVYSYTASGTKKWKSANIEKKTGLYWPYKIVKSGSKNVKVYYETPSLSGTSTHYVILNRKTGKIVSYK